MTDEVKCPKCGGPMWDQKNGKFPYKPGTPIFKCRNKAECDGVIWEPRTTGAAAPKPAPQKVAYNTPIALPGEFASEEEELRELHGKTQPTIPQQQAGIREAKIAAAAAEWNVARKRVLEFAPDFANDWQALNAACATILIQASKAA